MSIDACHRFTFISRWNNRTDIIFIIIKNINVAGFIVSFIFESWKVTKITIHISVFFIEIAIFRIMCAD